MLGRCRRAGLDLMISLTLLGGFMERLFGVGEAGRGLMFLGRSHNTHRIIESRNRPNQEILITEYRLADYQSRNEF